MRNFHLAGFFAMNCPGPNRVSPLVFGVKVLILTLVFAGTAAAQTQENGITAHRGNSGEYPENSLVAFESAILMGADWIELDIIRTRDGKLVVCHDPNTKHLTGVDRIVAESTFEELKQLDMAKSFRDRVKITEEDCPPLRILLFEDALKLFLQHKKARVSIQPKNDCVDEAIDIIRKLNARNWVGFNDGNLKYMARVKELEPGITVFWDRFDWNVEKDIETAKKHGFEALIVHHSKIGAPEIQAVQKAGLKIGVWTVNDPAVMKKFLGYGIDRIYTDFPRMLLSLKREGVYSFHFLPDDQ